MNEILERLRSRFPLSELTPMNGGGTNLVLYLRKNEMQSVIKVTMISNKYAQTELMCLCSLKDTGLSPQLLQSFQIENKKALQMEYIEGRTILESILTLRKESRLDEIPSIFSSMGKFLAELHAIPLQVDLNEIALTIPKDKSFIDSELYQRSIDRISNLKEHSKVLLHGDFGYHNIIAAPTGRMTLIDWELAGIGDPRIDISNVLFWTHLHFPEVAQKCVDEFLITYDCERNMGFSPRELNAFVIIQVWRTIELINENFPENVIKEWNRRLSWLLDHDFV